MHTVKQIEIDYVIFLLNAIKLSKMVKLTDLLCNISLFPLFRVDGTIEREGPGTCGEYICPVGFTGDACVIQTQDKLPPKPLECPQDIWVVTPNSSAQVTWKEPSFIDSMHTLYVMEHKGLTPGTFSFGICLNFALRYLFYD